MESFFTDNVGENWKVRFGISETDRVKAGAGIDLLMLGDKDAPLISLVSDYAKAAEVLYYFCREQCEQRSKTMQDFYNNLDGDAIRRGIEAVWSAAEGFFPAEQKLLLSRLVAEVRTFQERNLKDTEKALKDPRLKEAFEKEYNRNREKMWESIERMSTGDELPANSPAS